MQDAGFRMQGAESRAGMTPFVARLPGMACRLSECNVP
jgi:hypothetical protein